MRRFTCRVTMTWQGSPYNHTGNNRDGDSWYSQWHTQLRYFRSHTTTVATGFYCSPTGAYSYNAVQSNVVCSYVSIRYI